MEGPGELIAESLARFGIERDRETVARLASYAGELERWGRTMNLSGLKEAGRIVTGLIYDAFFIRSRIPETGSLLDLGSGAGVVALPLAILDPERRIFSIEKTLKKVLFQRHVKRLLGLDRLKIVHARAEDAAPLGVDLLVAKAFGPATAVLDKGGRHLAAGGLAFLVRGKGEKPAGGPGFILERAESYRLPGAASAYQLFVYKKVP
jgi:16S rRNA (guanine527-N7)-methyltransferase